MVNFDAVQLGKVLGGNITKTEGYRDDFIENEEFNDLLLGFLGRVIVTGKLVVTAWYYAEDSFVLDHPVLGEIDSSVLKIDGGYAPSGGDDVVFPAGEEYEGDGVDEVLY